MGSNKGDYAEFFESLDGKEIAPGVSVVLEKGKIRSAEEGETPIGIISPNPFIVGNLYDKWPKQYIQDKFGCIVMETVKKEKKAPKKKKVVKERQKTEKKTTEDEVPRSEIVQLENGKYVQKEIVEKVPKDIEKPVFEEVDLYDASATKVIGEHKIPVMETYEVEEDVLDEDGKPVMEGTGEFVLQLRVTVKNTKQSIRCHNQEFLLKFPGDRR